MTTYADKSFNAAHYDNARPSYPSSFYRVLMDYHQRKNGDTNLAVDVGCGTGLVTFELAKYFDQVIGTDPSTTMIDQCNTKSIDNIKFMVGSAEAFPDEIAANSVDMITGAECIHWVDHGNFFQESARILKPGGTLAYWFYKDPIMVGYPEANDLYDKYCYGDNYMGKYWQQPGRNFLRTFMKEVEIPPIYDNIIRVEYLKSDFLKPTPLSIKMTVRVDWWESYIKSWSAYHSWMKENGHKSDIAEDFLAELKQVLNWSNDTQIELIWETMYTFATKKK